MKNITLNDLKRMFTKQVNTSHIEYDRDGGHSYSYIKHPLMSGHEWEDDDRWLDFTNEWLSENEDLPPCDIYVNHKEQKIESSCGCHDGLDYHNNREEWESIVFELENE